ncbi:ABC transporter ATP-binding protein [Pelagibius litoralis]|uniref:ABC transporter ATP-binding protein n=1 Tax=Pelagibius litoralis TaxID=374515 RepID=A0A967F0C6_9PROT|nr:ABC transporter ATP-binding protein [Pelagibius litoralis]NIA70686.1 ABC transporter ATP-binding protein [Pelagibius litoralis]
MARLEIEGLCKGWDFPVIDRLDLTVEEGEFFVVVGPSGIGKTTLLRLVAGLERPDAGTIRVGERDLTGLPPYRRRVAMTFESYALYPHLSVFENIASPLRARGMAKAKIDETVMGVAKLLRIEQLLNRRPGEISGGQKQRTALGRTLVAEPDVFLLDEPISHLDAKIRHELRLQFHTLEALRSVATLYVTHDYAEALSLGDRIGVMGEGGLLQVGTAREIFQRPQHLFVAKHLGQPSINVVEASLGMQGDALHFAAEGAGLALPVAGPHSATLAGRDAGRITVGIRPQHVQVVKDGQTTNGSAVVEARVEMYEALGATGILVAESGGVRLMALTPPDAIFQHGEPVRLALRSEAFLYFDADSGRNVMVD